MRRRKLLLNAVAAIAATATSLKITAPPASAGEPASHTVEIRNLVFSPATLSVRAGDRVTWINRDFIPHTATAEDGSWDTGELGANQQSEITVTNGFVESYFCRFHPSMIAKLDVS